jgi:hypothetical protein
MNSEKEYISKLNLPEYPDILKIDLPSRKREWMDVNNGHAYKCLPLNVANGFGWNILCPITFDATWNGNLRPENSIEFNFFPEDNTSTTEYILNHKLISSHFGNGIITFSGMNYILRTSKNNNIFVKGPTNYFKHGAQALEAVIETDWIPYNFTLNWKITKPNEKVEFKKNEPIATFFPIPRNYLENFETKEENLEITDDLYLEHRKWVEKRNETQKENKTHNFYTRGIENIDENKLFDNHQRAIIGCPFKFFKKDKTDE